jgi:hypothetical protein
VVPLSIFSQVEAGFASGAHAGTIKTTSMQMVVMK